MPDRLKKDPIVATVDALDRSRRWLVVLAGLVAALTIAVVILGVAYRDLSRYIKQPTGRENRLDYQCAVERRLHLREVDCRG